MERQGRGGNDVKTKPFTAATESSRDLVEKNQGEGERSLTEATTRRNR